ncbi:MAG: hypothetical protein HY517_03310 [Candidatus Aenigmarchaeota archaeon]|nr:hypothetical protein [Candidatus Aenigmarchaeota archaeon]
MMMGNVEKAGNDVKTAERPKAKNFEESGVFSKNPRENHITDFWVNLKNDESREISAYGSREISPALSLCVLSGVEP